MLGFVILGFICQFYFRFKMQYKLDDFLVFPGIPTAEVKWYIPFSCFLYTLQSTMIHKDSRPGLPRKGNGIIEFIILNIKLIDSLYFWFREKTLMSISAPQSPMT